jgi:hypothetical protein
MEISQECDRSDYKVTRDEPNKALLEERFEGTPWNNVVVMLCLDCRRGN